MPQKTILSLLVTFLLSVAAVAQTPPITQAKVNIIIDRETIRFAPQEAPQELRLVVTDQAGAELYDSGPLAVATLDWPLRDTQGEAVKGGLYLYTLSIKDGAGELSQRRGYLIVNRTGDTDGIWLATSDKVGIGAGSESTQLAVVGNRDVTLGRAELPGSVPPRAALGERSELPQRKTDQAGNEKNEKAAAPAAPTSTANQVAKFAGDGVSLIDSAISEVSGNVGIGTTAPQSGLDYRNILAPFFTRDIGTTNLGGTQSALQLGVSNLGSRNVNVGPAFLFFADNSAGAKSFLGRVAGAWENPTAGAEAGYLRFQVRAHSGDTGASTERMRITASGNVGIGTVNPTALLHLMAGWTRLRMESTQYDTWPSLELKTPGREWHVGTGGPNVFNDLKNKFYIRDHTVGLERLVINPNGNVGIGVGDPTVKLQVAGGNNAGIQATSQGNAILGYSTTSGFAAIYGENTTTSSFGVYGKGGGSGTGVWGEGNKGVYGKGFYGVFGTSTHPNGAAIYGEVLPDCPSATSDCLAGFFGGRVRIRGSLYVSDLSSGYGIFSDLVWGKEFIETSDRNVKANFASVDNRAILQRLAAIPIQTWNFKSQPEAVRHIGPMAQDFRAAFNLGTDDKHISLVDVDGVALAAIQGLYQLVQEKEKQLAQQSGLLNQLQARLVRLERTAKKRSAVRQRTRR